MDATPKGPKQETGSYLLPAEGKDMKLNQIGDKTEIGQEMKGNKSWIGSEKPPGAVCLIAHSPYRILKVAAKGNLEEFEKLYNADQSRLNVRDHKGLGTLHHAASKGRIVIMDFILAHGGDINVMDNNGNSPLHISVENKEVDSINYLITNGADTAGRNHKFLTPLILAIDLGLVSMVEALLKHEEVSPEDPGENGAKPLHYCAFKDEAESAKLLLARNAKPCSKCDNGLYPIHAAAYHAAAKTMNVLIEKGESMGYTREQMLSFADKENNHALHAAVNSGDLQAVRVCLSAGAPVDAQQDDKSTPLHFAASQGNLEMTELMFEIDVNRACRAVNMKDSLGMSPLHRAAIFNHEMVVRSLIKHGGNINAQDDHNRSPLMVAASKGGWNTVRFLLQNGALIDIKDQENRNFLHLAIKSGARLHQFGCELIKNVKNLLNDKDYLGCTPLHYASREGFLSTIEDLIGLGAMLNPKNNDRQSPFHFAARYGRYNTCRRLLDSEQGPNIINESDNNGLSALHIASGNGHIKVVSLLMQRGAAIHKDFSGNSALHLAAASGYTQCMRLLLGVHSNLLNAQNKAGDTALHVAANEGHTSAITLLLTLGANMEKNYDELSFMDFILDSKHSDSAMAVVTHDRWKEVMDLCSVRYRCAMIGLIQQLPEITLVVLDRCQTYSPHDRKDRHFHITYNFKYLQCPISYIKRQIKMGEDAFPMMAVNAMVKFGRVECLSHPVCVNFLKMKWNAYGMWFHFFNLGIYLVFLSLLTNFVIRHDATMNMEDGTSIPTTTVNQTNTTGDANSSSTKGDIQLSTSSKLSLYVIIIFCVLNTLKEVGQMIQQKRRYFLDQSNLMEWALYVTCAVFAVPFLCGMSDKFQWEAGALGVFLAWFNLLLYLQRFDFFGIYVVMFLEILSTVLQVLCVFSILIVAFGLSFFMLMGHEESRAHATPGLSIMRTVMMMLELDYMESFNRPYTDDDPNTLPFSNLTFCLLALFVLLMPMLLMNLLIGLAVGDIESVQRDARLKRLAMQVEHHTDLERKLPQKILEKVDKVEYDVYPNCGQQFIMSLLMKMTAVSDSDGDDLHCKRGFMIGNSRLYEEMSKQKQRIKEINQAMSKQHDLLRLIVQKMEINTEDDYRDEGTYNDSLENLKNGISHSQNKGWSSPALRQNITQSTVITKWRKGMKKNP